MKSMATELFRPTSLFGGIRTVVSATRGMKTNFADSLQIRLACLVTRSRWRKKTYGLRVESANLPRAATEPVTFSCPPWRTAGSVTPAHRLPWRRRPMRRRGRIARSVMSIIGMENSLRRIQRGELCSQFWLFDPSCSCSLERARSWAVKAIRRMLNHDRLALLRERRARESATKVMCQFETAYRAARQPAMANFLMSEVDRNLAEPRTQSTFFSSVVTRTHEQQRHLSRRPHG